MKTPAKRSRRSSRRLAVVVSRCLVVAGACFFLAKALSQTAPILTIAKSGTNQVSVTITNAIGTNVYDLKWNSVLVAESNTNFPWAYAAIGVPGGTNFLLEMDTFPATFFQAVSDNLAVPLWQAADPNNPTSAVLTVTILSPTNGANLTQ